MTNTIITTTRWRSHGTVMMQSLKSSCSLSYNFYRISSQLQSDAFIGNVRGDFVISMWVFSGHVWKRPMNKDYLGTIVICYIYHSNGIHPKCYYWKLVRSKFCFFCWNSTSYDWICKLAILIWTILILVSAIISPYKNDVAI